LCDPFDNPNNDESCIAEEVTEDIELSIFDFPGIDLIEKLEENEDLEDKGEMEYFLSSAANN